MRLEKILWEKAINVKALGRQRELSSPSKWHVDVPHYEKQLMAKYYFSTAIRGFLFRALEPFWAWFLWRMPLESIHQKGLAWEDVSLFTERELRREVLHENIVRQTCHPYQHILFKKRRARYYKIERMVRGFFVPEHVRKEAESRLVADTNELKDEWEEHVQNNYYSDMTPATRSSSMANRYIPLDVFNVYGLLRQEAWQRYFYNESYYDGYSADEYDQFFSNPFPEYNLDSAEGRKAFEARVNRFCELYPYYISQPGQSINFPEFYARHAIITGRDTSKMDPQLVAEMRERIEQEEGETSSLSLPESDTQKVGKSTIGTVYPRRLESKHKKVMM